MFWPTNPAQKGPVDAQSVALLAHMGIHHILVANVTVKSLNHTKSKESKLLDATNCLDLPPKIGKLTAVQGICS